MRKVLNPCFVVAIGTLFSAMSTSVGQDTKKSPAQEPDFGVFKIPDGTPKPKDTLLSTVIVGSEVLSVAISPDGTLLATAESEGPAKLWDVKTGKLRATLNQDSVGNAESVAFALGGKIVIVAGDLEVPKNPLAFDGVNENREGISIWDANGKFVMSTTLTQATQGSSAATDVRGRHVYRGKINRTTGFETPIARLDVTRDGRAFAVTRPGGADHFTINQDRSADGSLSIDLDRLKATCGLESWPLDVAVRNDRLFLLTTQMVKGEGLDIHWVPVDTSAARIVTQVEEWLLNERRRYGTVLELGADLEYEPGLYGDYYAMSSPAGNLRAHGNVISGTGQSVTLAAAYRIIGSECNRSPAA